MQIMGFYSDYIYLSVVDNKKNCCYFKWLQNRKKIFGQEKAGNKRISWIFEIQLNINEKLTWIIHNKYVKTGSDCWSLSIKLYFDCELLIKTK